MSSTGRRFSSFCGLGAGRSGAVVRTAAVLAALCALLLPGAAQAQQQGSITGKVLDPDGLALPGASVTVVSEGTGYSRTYVTAATGAFTVQNLQPGKYRVTATMSGFQDVKREVQLTAGLAVTLDLKLRGVGLQEEVTVEGVAPLVEATSSKVGGSLSGREIEDVPSNFRNFTALTQLIPGMTPNPAASTFEGGQVVANGSPAQSNVYLIDGMYNNDDRLGGSQGTQVRVVLDNISEYQVLSNSYSAEYGGGAGAVVNMVSRGGTNDFTGRVYTYFRDDKFNARGHFLPAGAAKPDERTLQMGVGLGGPIIKDKAHFYFTYEKDNEDIAGQKRFPANAAPLARDFVGAFEVRATNIFARVDVQLTPSNFLSLRAIREKAPTRGEGFNTNTETIDAQGWEEDLDELANLTLTTTLSDRASNVLRVGIIHEQLNTGAQAYFTEDVEGIGFNGRDPFSIGQRNTHPSYITGKGGTGALTTIHTYLISDSFSYFVPDWLGGEHTFKLGGAFSLNRSDPRASLDSGTFQFNSDLPYNPANPATFPFQFDVLVGPLGDESFAFNAYDRRTSFFVEDKFRASSKLTLNLGARYDDQRITPGGRHNFAPRVGFAWDVQGNSKTVVRGGIGKFYLYMPISGPLNAAAAAVRTAYPSITITSATDTCGCVLRPDVIRDSQGNLGVAVLSPAAQAFLNNLRAQALAGTTFNRNPRLLDPDRKLAYQWAYSFGFSRELGRNAAVTLDFVGNISRDQTGEIDINAPRTGALRGTRPGVNVFDPNGEYITGSARNTSFQRVRLLTSDSALDGDYKSLQAAFVKRMANRWSGRLSYTLQKANYVGLGNPDARTVWINTDIEADYGRFASNRTHVLAMSGTLNLAKNLNLSAVLSAISGAPINETVGTDFNGDNNNNDRPIRGVSEEGRAIVSEVDGQGRAVINGLDGPGSFLIDASLRYSIPLGSNSRRSLDLFYDMFNVLNRENLVAPSGNRRSALFMVPTAAQFPRQMQFGARIRF
jgi:hypothetical protein